MAVGREAGAMKVTPERNSLKRGQLAHVQSGRSIQHLVKGRKHDDVDVLWRGFLNFVILLESA